jgi:hypothetical protein
MTIWAPVTYACNPSYFRKLMYKNKIMIPVTNCFKKEERAGIRRVIERVIFVLSICIYASMEMSKLNHFLQLIQNNLKRK